MVQAARPALGARLGWWHDRRGGRLGGGTAVAGAIYVAPDGDDANPGTLAQPLKTVAKARDLVRTKNSAMTADITVYLRGGTYPQTSTLTFANADSGTGGFYVKYMAYPGERPLITGGQPIKGWKVSDATNNIYSASAGTTAFRQLYVNGVKAIRARTPNLLANNVANFNRLSGWDKTANNLQVPSSAVATWNNLTKVEMHVNIAWGDSTLRIASITNSGTTALVKFQSPESPMVFVRPNPNMAQVGWGSGRAYYFENALEFLDQAGEWYLDETTSTVYYKPRTRRGHDDGHGHRADGGDHHERERYEHLEPGELPVVSGPDLRPFDVHASKSVRLPGCAGGPVQPDGRCQQQPDRWQTAGRRQRHQRQPPALRKKLVHADGRHWPRLHLGHP